jgi:hypothetical protein
LKKGARLSLMVDAFNVTGANGQTVDSIRPDFSTSAKPGHVRHGGRSTAGRSTFTAFRQFRLGIKIGFWIAGPGPVSPPGDRLDDRLVSRPVFKVTSIVIREPGSRPPFLPDRRGSECRSVGLGVPGGDIPLPDNQPRRGAFFPEHGPFDVLDPDGDVKGREEPAASDLNQITAGGSPDAKRLPSGRPAGPSPDFHGEIQGRPGSADHGLRLSTAVFRPPEPPRSISAGA